MPQSPQDQTQDSPASKGMPIYFDDGRDLTDIAEDDDKRHDWHPANPAATKLFRCIECLRDIEEMLKSAGRSKSKVKQRRKMKIMLTPLHSLATGIRDLLNDLENNPYTAQKLPKGAREIVPELRTRFLANVAIGNGDLLSQTRNKISAHVDKDLHPGEARALLSNAKPAQVGWWLGVPLREATRPPSLRYGATSATDFVAQFILGGAFQERGIYSASTCEVVRR